MASVYLTVVYEIDIEELDNIDPVDNEDEWNGILEEVESDPRKYINDGNTDINSWWVEV